MAKKLNLGSLSSKVDNAELAKIKKAAVAGSSWPSEKGSDELAEDKPVATVPTIEAEQTIQQAPVANKTERKFPPHDRVVTVEYKRINPTLAKVWSNNPRPSADATSLIPKIVATKGNTIPALVRYRPTDEQPYEIVYGQRRHLACLETGFDLFVEVADLTDEEADIQAHMENEGREELDVFSLGRYYQKKLNEERQSNPQISERGFAEKKGESKTVMNNYLRLAKLDIGIQDLPTKKDVLWSARQGLKAISLTDKLDVDELSTFIETQQNQIKTPALCIKALESYVTTLGKLEVKADTVDSISVGGGIVTVKRKSNGSIAIQTDKNVPKQLADDIVTMLKNYSVGNE